MNDEEQHAAYYQRRMEKADQMAGYVLGCLFLAGLCVLAAIFWGVVS